MKSEYLDAYTKVDNLFESVYENGGSLEIKGVNFIYRDNQHTYALDVMDAIKNKSILLIQGPTGIGKTVGYVIPVISSIGNIETFNKVIISTSNMALQEQLLKDISTMSRVLEIPIKTQIAKGMNNYVCLARIERLLDSDNISSKDKEQVQNLLQSMLKQRSADRQDLINVSGYIWKKVVLQNRGICSKCSYATSCYYAKKQQKIDDANIIITNHAYLSYIMRRKEKVKINSYTQNPNLESILDNVDGIIIDEAHKLEENLREEKELSFNELKYLIGVIRKSLNFRLTGIGLTGKINQLFEYIKESTNEEIDKNKSRISKKDIESISFSLTKEIKASLSILLGNSTSLGELKKFFIEAKQGYITRRKKDINLGNNLNRLEECIWLLEDLSRERNSHNIYYARFYWDKSEQNIKVKIAYKSKSITNTMRTIYDKKIPIVFTSATMLGYKGNYEPIKRKLSLDEVSRSQNLEESEVLESPYDYTKNSLVYYNPNLPNPKTRYQTVSKHLNYINSLVKEIDRIIRITNGKSLILFTSKEDMQMVYDLLKHFEYPFPILIADSNPDKKKQEFASVVNSCLLATGSFWEGIDIKGTSLSNVIICHLPFPMEDPLVKYEASKYKDEEKMTEVYLNEMLRDLAQGTGRLIRDVNDKGVICILDPRTDKYLEYIKRVLPFKNYTTDLKDIEEFVEENIDNQNRSK